MLINGDLSTKSVLASVIHSLIDARGDLLNANGGLFQNKSLVQNNELVFNGQIRGIYSFPDGKSSEDVVMQIFSFVNIHDKSPPVKVPIRKIQ